MYEVMLHYLVQVVSYAKDLLLRTFEMAEGK